MVQAPSYVSDPSSTLRTDVASAGYVERIAFVLEVAERLHAYGTTAQRLEAAVVAVAQRLGLECEPWSNPTGMILSFSDPRRSGGVSETTRVIRLAPGDTDLRKLCEADRIAEDVMAGRVGIAEGHAQLAGLDRPAGWRGRAMQVFGFGLASAAVAGLLRLPWLDIATAGLIGLMIGALELASQSRPRLQEAGDAVSGLIAALPGTPISADQWALLRAGNVGTGLPGLKALGVTARPLGLFLERWMVRFRTHGRFGSSHGVA